ncbi:DUF2382 domain-containing protein [Spirosoma sp. HMF4905]|uniref:DUF2382 domain-containing protein n=1 Tax=Spirosoma arboris TaxID=2682092 RepID=A0A7K1SF73_9BACT|nr:YsnF/AvaK domain-containing protein [Spirosoma arboris]MVM32467.1 DUF2382 domain-containing protein [Spirosoma arboris]
MNALPESGSLTDGTFPDSGAPTHMARIAEQLHVSTQPIETGRVTLTKTVHETEETVTIPLLREEYTVERVARDEYVDELPVPRQEGHTTIYPVVKEVLVVQKRLLLIEEIRVTRQQTQTRESQTVILRQEDIVVERTPINSERPV